MTYQSNELPILFRRFELFDELLRDLLNGLRNSIDAIPVIERFHV